MAGQRRNTRHKKKAGRGFGVIALALILLLIGGWGAVQLRGGSALSGRSDQVLPAPAAGGAGTSSASGSGARFASPGPMSPKPGFETQVAAELAACRDRVRSAEAVVAAARPGVGNWTAHVQSRTDLLAKRASESEAEKVWDRTTAAGPADLKRFREAFDPFGTQKPCAPPEDVPRKYADIRDNCAQRAAAGDEAVKAAQGAIGDWDAHLKDMKALDKGRMTAKHAQMEWVEAWKAAPVNLDAYGRTGEALGKAPACEPPAS